MSDDLKTKKRVLRQLENAAAIAKAAGVTLIVPSSVDGVTLQAVYGLRHALAGPRIAAAKRSTKRRLLQSASTIVLCSEKILVGASPLVPDSHRSAVRPMPATPTPPSRSVPTVEDDLCDAFEDDGEDD